MTCNTKNPLIRDGVSQKQRFATPLNPAFAQVDERKLEDLLYFLVDYSKQINFYNTNNQLDGDWKSFLEKDISVIISLISKKDASIVFDFFEAQLKIITDGSSSEVQVKNAFKSIFDLIFSVLHEVDKWYAQTTEGLGIQSLLKRFIRSQLKFILEQVIAVYKSALVDPILIDENYVNPSSEIVSGLELTGSSIILNDGLHDVWFTGSMAGSGFTNWNDFYTSISPDHSVFGSERLNPAVLASSKIRNSLTKFNVIFDELYAVLVQIIEQAPSLNEQTLTNYASHEPHAGLLLSFLKLFKHAQDHLNSITKKHLDYYYEQILKLKRLEAVPDKVHLVFELAKHVDSHRLEMGTQLKAGKDATGVEVYYQTVKENVFNKAKIEKLRSVFVEKDKNWQVYASPTANSADGKGAKLDKENPKWKAFGESQLGSTDDDRTMPDAEIGFALSSALLSLQEGVRYIILQISCTNKIAVLNPDISEMATFSLSGEKGWITKSDFPGSLFYFIAFEKTIFAMIMLEESAPAIFDYNQKIHKGNFDTMFPVLKIVANPKALTGSFYQVLKDAVIEKVKLDVYAFGMKNLIVQTDNGVVDPSKPFAPFGSIPVKGSNLYIGSREVFSKNPDALLLGIKWHGMQITSATATGEPLTDLQAYYNYNAVTYDPITTYNPANTDFKCKLEILNKGNWVNLLSGNENISIFNSSNANSLKYFTLDEDNSNLAIGAKTDLEKFTEYSVSSDRGFIRLVLDKPNDAFGHKFYASLLTKQLIKRSIILPVEPVIPQISEISLSYKSSETINLFSDFDFEKRTSKFFHQLPFGIEEIHQKIYGSTLYLLPQFEHDDKGVIKTHNGEFYIGLVNLEPPQNLSILIKVAEGSADPTLKKQSVDWFYLSENKWLKFETSDILSDTTNGLLTTGIISFSIPLEATKDNTIMDTGYHWIMAAIIEKTNAVCDIIDVFTQAGLAEYKDNGNDPDFLASPLEAETIGKLKVKQAEIKSVRQPFASFGGKIAENDTDYYQRVSERLRHKKRGISIWDYERMVLQEFLEIYKVKCINHSVYDLEISPDELLTSEFAPGYITLIVVPDLKNQNAINPLEPRVSLNTLELIRTFLSKKISPFAAEKLQVINPLFEKIQVEFYVEFNQGFDRGFYEKQIIHDIIAFLSPWAFQEGADIVFGGKIHRSVILNFMEKLAYVDFVTDFKMNHHISETTIRYDIEEAVATTARSILVSFDTHIIIEKSTCS